MRVYWYSGDIEFAIPYLQLDLFLASKIHIDSKSIRIRQTSLHIVVLDESITKCSSSFTSWNCEFWEKCFFYSSNCLKFCGFSSSWQNIKKESQKKNVPKSACTTFQNDQKTKCNSQYGCSFVIWSKMAKYWKTPATTWKVIYKSQFLDCVCRITYLLMSISFNATFRFVICPWRQTVQPDMTSNPPNMMQNRMCCVQQMQAGWT